MRSTPDQPSPVTDTPDDDACEIAMGGRRIGRGHPPLVIAEIGINHEGNMGKARRMVIDAADAGCECVKFQCHIIDDEMIPNNVVPGNARESIWEIMRRCALDRDQEMELKELAESRGMIYLSTPFSRAAADRLAGMNVVAFKIGSGECNNYPLVEHIAGFGRPVILSTGMNDISSISASVSILRNHGISFALMHCTSIYPTPYDKIRLGAMTELASTFPGVPVGLSDHSLSNYPCLGAVALGASLVERHFTSDKSWPGPDINISMDPAELRDLIAGARALHQARGGAKTILKEEQPTIDFAYACVVAQRDIAKGSVIGTADVWVKRPGTGEILARDYPRVLGMTARRNIAANEQIRWEYLD